MLVHSRYRIAAAAFEFLVGVDPVIWAAGLSAVSAIGGGAVVAWLGLKGAREKLGTDYSIADLADRASFRRELLDDNRKLRSDLDAADVRIRRLTEENIKLRTGQIVLNEWNATLQSQIDQLRLELVDHKKICTGRREE